MIQSASFFFFLIYFSPFIYSSLHVPYSSTFVFIFLYPTFQMLFQHAQTGPSVFMVKPWASRFWCLSSPRMSSGAQKLQRLAGLKRDKSLLYFLASLLFICTWYILRVLCKYHIFSGMLKWSFQVVFSFHCPISGHRVQSSGLMLQRDW